MARVSARWRPKAFSSASEISPTVALARAAFTESSNRRATVGKRIIGLQVVTSSGGKLSFGQASVRHFMKFLSLFTVAVGFLMAAWTKRHQALHDMPADCVVIRTAEPCLSLLGKQP